MTVLGPIRQIAYFVPDIRAAAQGHAKRFGSGPYFVRDAIEVPRAWHRGAPVTFDHGSAYGQWGEVMIEFTQQNNRGPSPFHDLYPENSGRYGLHHVAVFADSLDESLAYATSIGFETALLAELPDGMRFAMVAASESLGHMVELYEPVDALVGFYELVRSVAGTGGEVLREMG